jgi:iron complex transport system substrate-binding protein
MKVIIILTAILFSLPVQAEIPKRVITVGGSLTEIVYALDAQSLLVGSDTTSYYPQAAESLPKVGYQRTLSAEGILSLQPDLVIVTEEAGPPAVLKQLQATGVDLLSLKSSRTLSDVKNNITQIGEALNATPQAQNLLNKVNQQGESLQNILESSKDKLQVLFLLQHAGGAPMVAGKDTAADSIIKLSGANNVVDDFEGYKPFTPEAVIAMQPDVILVTAQGLEQVGGLNALLKIPGLAQTPAGQQQRVLVMDSLLLLGFGPRTAQAALELHQMYNDI